MAMTKEQRVGAVKHLTTNCDCWKGQEASLNSMSDDALERIKKQADKSEKALAVANKLTEGIKLGGTTMALVLNSEGKIVVTNKFPKKGEETEEGPAEREEEECDPEDPECMAAMEKNKAKAKNSKAPNEEYSAKPPATNAAPSAELIRAVENKIAESLGFKTIGEAKNTLNHAKGVEVKSKQALVNKITANVAAGEHKDKLTLHLMGKSIPDLKVMESLLPPTTNSYNQDEPTLDYSGAAGGYFPHPVNNEEMEVLNFEEERQSYDPAVLNAKKTTA